MKAAPQWGRLPAELRGAAQWLLASPDAHGDLKVPTGIDAAGAPRICDAHDSANWLTFDVACGAALHYGLAVGFCVSATDPWVCIDLDVKNATNCKDPAKWTPNEVVASHGMIMGTFQSYTERSQSGQGLHIWVRGPNFGQGVKREFVEVYCQERFLVCTGDIVLDKPVRADATAGEMVLALVARMREAQQDDAIELEELEEVDTDAEVVEALTAQVNGDKYVALCNGDWQAMGFPSGSEADLALLSMLCYRSRSNAQVRRLFRMTTLGKDTRKNNKINKNDKYIDRTLKIIRGRQAREDAATAQGAALAAGMLENLRATQAGPVAAVAHAAGVAAQGGPQTGAAGPVPLPWPPGYAGVLARFIYESSPRPVREVSIVSALGLLAGICGKAWNIPQSGINMYIVLVARSAVGKEAMHGGISKIIAQMSGMGYPTIQQFVDFNKYASGPALTKAVALRNSFVNVAGEWGKTLASMASEEHKTSGPLASLRTVMTDLYQKSAHNSIVGGIGYSDKEKNVASVSGVAYSMIGETTPSTFFESLTDTMMADGFLSRFLIVEYDGDRPEINYYPKANLEQEHCNQLHAICDIAVKTQTSVKGVAATHEAVDMMHAFNLECDMQINSTRTDEAYRQMWNRAHLKVLRLAALLAVADAPWAPEVQTYHVEWALLAVRNDISVMMRRLNEGDVGVSDHSRERKLMTYISEYLTQPVPESYAIPKNLLAAGVVPRKYLQVRSQKTPSFTQHPMGATRALDDTLRSMVDSGYLQELTKDKLATDYAFTGKAYRVLEISKGYRR